MWNEYTFQQIKTFPPFTFLYSEALAEVYAFCPANEASAKEALFL